MYDKFSTVSRIDLRFYSEAVPRQLFLDELATVSLTQLVWRSRHGEGTTALCPFARHLVGNVGSGFALGRGKEAPGHTHEYTPGATEFQELQHIRKEQKMDAESAHGVSQG